MTAEELLPGDTVRLRSGGPDMTVASIDPISCEVRCWWLIGDGETDSGDFLPVCLDRVE